MGEHGNVKFEKPLHVGAPNIGDVEKFHQYVNEIFERRWFTNRGEVVLELERLLADYLGVKYCITTCNGTVGLEIATRALGVTGEVIVPSLTFIATAHSLQWQEIKPTFCDIERTSYHMDPAQVERHITPRTTAIMGVHTYGRPCDIEALQSIADKYDLRMIFDAAHAFGCTHKDQMIGNFGDCEVFSFHATKFFNTFEGGAVATNNGELAEKIRLMQNFGFAGTDNVIHIGTNGKMSEVNAAMGLVNLESIEEFLATNEENYDAYKTGLSAIVGITLAEFDRNEKYNRQYIVVDVGKEYPFSRDELVDKLRDHNVLARRYFWPGCHRMEPYRSLQPNAGVLLPVTEEVAERVLLLPTGTAVDPQIIEKVCQLIRNIYS